MQFFYDGQIRRYITQIVRLMSNFNYQDGDGALRTIPVMYGDITRQVANIMRDNSENKIMSAPRMGVYVTNLELDRNRLADASYVSKVHLRERAYDKDNNEYLNTQGKNYTVERLMPTPYTLSVAVDLWTTNTEQKLQILEQIIPFFQPDYTVSIKPIDGWTDFKQDVPIVLNSVAINDDYESDFLTRRVLTYTLGFTMKMTFYSSKGTQNVIKEIDIDYSDLDNKTLILADQNTQVDPNTAVVSDTQVTGTPGSGQYRIVTTIDFINQPQTPILELQSDAGTFSVGETITATSSGSSGRVGSFTPIVEGGTIIRKDLAIVDADGYFQPGETVTGATSNATGVITTWRE